MLIFLRGLVLGFLIAVPVKPIGIFRIGAVVVSSEFWGKLVSRKNHGSSLRLLNQIESNFGSDPSGFWRNCASFFRLNR
jgi:hypothetical protein